LFSNELAERYGGEGIVSISLHPGTNLSRHAGSLLHRIGRLFKFAGYYVISCGDLTYLTDESKSLTEYAKSTRDQARDHAEDVVTKAETSGTLPDIDISSHGAITSLYAGTTDAAGEFNGKVRLSWIRHSIGVSTKLFTVSHRLGTPHAPTSQGSQYGDPEEVVGMV
jgi:hypothetical protein